MKNKNKYCIVLPFGTLEIRRRWLFWYVDVFIDPTGGETYLTSQRKWNILFLMILDELYKKEK